VNNARIALIRQVIEEVSVEIGPRFAGTASERRAADYLAQQFIASGFTTRRQGFTFVGWESIGDPLVLLHAGEGKQLQAAPLLYSGATPSGGVRGRVAARAGKVVLIAGLYEKELFAIVDRDENEVAHLIVEADGPPIRLANPNPIIQFPQVVIGADEVRELRAALSSVDVLDVTVEVQARIIPDAQAANVIASALHPGQSPRVLVTAHIDTTERSPGAYDNASGMAALVALAHELPERADRISVGVDLVGFACEEVGYFGSKHFVGRLLQSGAMSEIAACLTLDMLSGGERLWFWTWPEDLQARVRQVASRLGLGRQYATEYFGPRAGADNWQFHLQGIPNLCVLFWRQAEYHKPTDTADKADPHKVSACVELMLGLLEHFSEAGQLQ